MSIDYTRPTIQLKPAADTVVRPIIQLKQPLPAVAAPRLEDTPEYQAGLALAKKLAKLQRKIARKLAEPSNGRFELGFEYGLMVFPTEDEVPYDNSCQHCGLAGGH